MKKRTGIMAGIVLAMALGASLGANAQSSDTRMITDLTGTQVEIPEAENIDKVMIVAPPLLSTYLNVVHDDTKLAGINPMSISDMNEELVPMLLPDKDSIRTDFLDGFASNTEEVLKMNPDIILIYGDAQKKGLENIDIPVVNFFIQDQQNESWSVKIDELMREIFDKDEEAVTLQDEWDETNKIVNPVLSGISEDDKKTGLMIMMNTGDSITVRGAGSYGDDWLTKSGLTNVAADIEGDGVEVAMEQIYEWNPDVIYVFRGAPAAGYINNKIDGQDWSLLSACKNGTVYDMPQGVFNWGAPNGDSPLTLEWMVMKNYPDTIDETAFLSRCKDYYQTHYGITVTDEILTRILNPAA